RSDPTCRVHLLLRLLLPLVEDATGAAAVHSEDRHVGPHRVLAARPRIPRPRHRAAHPHHSAGAPLLGHVPRPRVGAEHHQTRDTPYRDRVPTTRRNRNHSTRQTHLPQPEGVTHESCSPHPHHLVQEQEGVAHSLLRPPHGRC